MQIKHKIINAFDIPSYKMTPHFEEAFKFIDENLQKGNVFVHCAAGISRV
jgi:protein-tyrosine phosphatase